MYIHSTKKYRRKEEDRSDNKKIRENTGSNKKMQENSVEYRRKEYERIRKSTYNRIPKNSALNEKNTKEDKRK